MRGREYEEQYKQLQALVDNYKKLYEQFKKPGFLLDQQFCETHGEQIKRSGVLELDQAKIQQLNNAEQQALLQKLEASYQGQSRLFAGMIRDGLEEYDTARISTDENRKLFEGIYSHIVSFKEILDGDLKANKFDINKLVHLRENAEYVVDKLNEQMVERNSSIAKQREAAGQQERAQAKEVDAKQQYLSQLSKMFDDFIKDENSIKQSVLNLGKTAWDEGYNLSRNKTYEDFLERTWKFHPQLCKALNALDPQLNLEGRYQLSTLQEKLKEAAPHHRQEILAIFAANFKQTKDDLKQFYSDYEKLYEVKKAEAAESRKTAGNQGKLENERSGAVNDCIKLRNVVSECREKLIKHHHITAAPMIEQLSAVVIKLSGQIGILRDPDKKTSPQMLEAAVKCIHDCAADMERIKDMKITGLNRVGYKSVQLFSSDRKATSVPKILKKAAADVAKIQEHYPLQTVARKT